MSTELFSTLPYKVADITLADFGRKEISKCNICHLIGQSRE